MKLTLISDAWRPQINGVVTTLEHIVNHLQEQGHEILLITPDRFPTLPCPTYPSIRLAMVSQRKVAQLIEEFSPQYIHIATEGPLGLAARNFCTSRKLAHTTSLHTLFPEYINLRCGIPVNYGYAYLRWFHSKASCVLVTTQSIRNHLQEHEMNNLQVWSRGVDLERYHPDKKMLIDVPRPISMYAGRVAVEKNLDAFLQLDIPGTQFVVGDGPALASLKTAYPNARFVGVKTGEELAGYLASADVFVFPSHTDTFGVVMLEALASGVPVAAYPVPGPKDVITDPLVGCLHENLQTAVNIALTLNSDICRQFARRFSWQNCVTQFKHALTPIHTTPSGARTVIPVASESLH
ncbi:MAG: glycosyltransferase family 1 protein [Gammaproteobacteria bacterium]|nr:glycosyltransferase family 1 protein [Gammaproteobacteria bacterium]